MVIRRASWCLAAAICWVLKLTGAHWHRMVPHVCRFHEIAQLTTAQWWFCEDVLRGVNCWESEVIETHGLGLTTSQFFYFRPNSCGSQTCDALSLNPKLVTHIHIYLYDFKINMKWGCQITMISIVYLKIIPLPCPIDNKNVENTGAQFNRVQKQST